MARKVFISILGAGLYSKCIYQAKAESKNVFTSDSVCFIQEATLDYISKDWEENDKAIILLTDKAREVNWDKAIDIRKNSKGEEVPYEGLEKHLEQKKYPFSLEGIYIPDGKDEDEMWEIFDILFNQIEEGDELYLDLTHSFRYIPMLLLVFSNYAKFLKNTKTMHISYGNYDARDKNSNIAPIVDLLPIATLQDWTFAAADYIENGNSKRLVTLSNEQINPILAEKKGKDKSWADLKKCIISIEKVTEDMQLCRGKSLINSEFIGIIKSYFGKSYSLRLKALKPVLGKINESFADFKKGDDVLNGIYAADWCFDKGYYQQSATFLQETIISFFCYKYGFDKFDRDTRTVISKVFQSKDKKKEIYLTEKEQVCKSVVLKISADTLLSNNDFVKLFINLTELRNDFNHAGMRYNSMDVSKLKSETKNFLLDTSLHLQQSIESSVPYMLINLSNHPYSLWSEKQKKAAEEYGECIDMSFPDIDPCLNKKKMQVLIDEYYNKILEYNEAKIVTVHLMGEMSFSYALVGKLQKSGIKVIVSTANRNVTELSPNNKEVVFDFVQFREYPQI